MTRRNPALLAAALLPLAAFHAQDPADRALASITAEEMRAHVRFLADDLLEGRAPGTRGAELAAAYIAAQYQRIGLEPVDGGWMQEVPLTGRTLRPGSDVTFAVNGRRIQPALGSDVVVWSAAPDTLLELNAPLVFAGYGITAPEQNWDDFEDTDVRGKVLLVLVNDPPAPPEEPELFAGREMTYYGRWTYKLEEAARRGAAGVLLVHTTERAGYGWNVVRTSWTGEQLALPHTRGSPAPVPLQAWISGSFARDLLEGAGLELAELFVTSARRDFRPIDTGITLRARLRTEVRNFTSANVLGLLPGRDPQRSGEVVVYTAHYDHLGTGAPDDTGDSIFNGAYDNASGVGLLLEVAEAFVRLAPRPARSVLFVATTAEEAGLLGAEHYVRNPAFPLAQTMAVINVDGANLWGETEDVVVLGADRSTLRDIVNPRAAKLGMNVVPDPAPDRGFFFRSDHFPFVRAGVPAAYVEHGLAYTGRPPDWGARLLADYELERYHRPADEWSEEFDLSGAVQQAALAFLIGYDVARSGLVPAWDPGSEFAAVRERSRAQPR